MSKKHLPTSLKEEAEALARRYCAAVKAGILPKALPSIEQDTAVLAQRVRAAGFDPGIVREIRSDMAKDLCLIHK